MKYLKSIILLSLFTVIAISVFFNFDNKIIEPEIETIEEKALLEIITFDKNKAQFSLHHSRTAKSLEEWKNELGGSYILNAGFFDEFNNPTGYTVINGEVLNDLKYNSNTTGSIVIIDGKIDIIDTQIEEIPQISNQTIFQTFPILISNGNPNLSTDTQKFARRTILAEDYSNNIHIIIIDKEAVTLFAAMNKILNDSGLNIKTAINLDGGPSTGIISDNFTINSYSSLPLVLRVED